MLKAAGFEIIEGRGGLQIPVVSRTERFEAPDLLRMMQGLYTLNRLDRVRGQAPLFDYSTGPMILFEHLYRGLSAVAFGGTRGEEFSVRTAQHPNDRLTLFMDVAFLPEAPGADPYDPNFLHLTCPPVLGPNGLRGEQINGGARKAYNALVDLLT